jgi:hypothetical protein
MRRLLGLGVVVASVLGAWAAAPPAQAAPLPPPGGFAGSYPTITPPTAPGGTPSFILSGGTATFGTTGVGGFGLSRLTVDATPFTDNLPTFPPGGPATGPVNLSNPDDSMRMLVVTAPGQAGEADFSITNPVTVMETNAHPGGAITGSFDSSVALVSNTLVGVDLSGFGGGGTFHVDFTGIDFESVIDFGGGTVLPPQGGNGLAFYPRPLATSAVTVTFTLTPNGALPEPGSLALWALAAGAGLSWLRRRRGR